MRLPPRPPEARGTYGPTPPAPPWIESGRRPRPRRGLAPWRRTSTTWASPGTSRSHENDPIARVTPPWRDSARSIAPVLRREARLGVATGAGGSWDLGRGPAPDDAELQPAAPEAPPLPPEVNGLSLRYFFVGPGGRASAYASLGKRARRHRGSPARGRMWAVGVVRGAVDRCRRRAGREHQSVSGLPKPGPWIRFLGPRPFMARCSRSERLDFGWVVAEHASVWSSPSSRQKPIGTRAPFRSRRRTSANERAGTTSDHAGTMLQIDDAAWILARDVARPNGSAPPPEVTGASGALDRRRHGDANARGLRRAAPGLRDARLDGPRGRGHRCGDPARGSPHLGQATDLGHGQRRTRGRRDAALLDAGDVPFFVQFFDGSVALHGTYWHSDFGHVHSHGCVNLSPIDARWLFEFTDPRLPTGWSAVLPMPAMPSTLVRVR